MFNMSSHVYVYLVILLTSLFHRIVHIIFLNNGIGSTCHGFSPCGDFLFMSEFCWDLNPLKYKSINLKSFQFHLYSAVESKGVA